MADEYIRRSDALKGVELFQCGWAEIEAVQADYIGRLPAADVAPVVRCKDCKYGDYDSKPDGAMVCMRTKDGFWRKETDFCSYGERKDNDERELLEDQRPVGGGGSAGTVGRGMRGAGTGGAEAAAGTGWEESDTEYGRRTPPRIA